MNRPWLIWSAFGVCLAVVLSAMAWTTLTVMRLEDNAQRQVVREENVRLALWRMDSAVAPLLAQESAMPYFAYGAFYPARRSYAEMLNASGNNEPLLPSPLLTRGAPHAQLYFQFDPNGQISSPQVPTQNNMKLAQAACALPEKVEQATKRMSALQTLVTRQQLLDRLPSEKEADKNGVSFVYPGNFDAPVQNAIVPQNAAPLPVNEKQAPAQSEPLSKDNDKPLSDNDNNAQKLDQKNTRQSKSSNEWQRREHLAMVLLRCMPQINTALSPPPPQRDPPADVDEGPAFYVAI